MEKANLLGVLAISIFSTYLSILFFGWVNSSFFREDMVVFVTIMGISFILSHVHGSCSSTGIYIKGFDTQIPPGGNLMGRCFSLRHHNGGHQPVVLDHYLKEKAGKSNI